MRALAALVVALVLTGSAAADAPRYVPSAADTVAARAALLRLTDFGLGWEGGETATEPLASASCPGFNPKASDLTVTGHVNAAFRNRQLGLDLAQDVQVMAAESLVRTDFARTIRPQLAACLAYELRHAKGQPSIDTVTVKQLQFPGRGYTGSLTKHLRALYRAEVTFLVGHRHVRFISDYVFLGIGNTEFTLNLIVPAADRDQLIPFETAMAELLAKRVG
ncbi:MAG: hypothetical protein F2663_05840 [Actinobacteria bacterium]|uniref:Unannotated protein n=1 Tax=freshwater metagenome TaxID=449393 RepID=A0A6J6PNA7_9ZZZZ|nr:hypothetical protein [Actinomycetota bacterium]